MGYTTKMLCLQALVVLCILSSVNGNCATFSFPTIDPSPSYTAAKDKQLHLPFVLNTDRCGPIIKEHKIIVSQQDKQKNISKDICILIAHPNGTCYHSYSPDCKCEGAKGHYSMNRIMTTSDETVWRWKLVTEGVEQGIRQLEFFVRDSPSTKRPPTTFKTSDTTVGPKTRRTPGTGTEAKYTTTNTTTGHSTGERVAGSPLVIGIVIAVVVLVVIIAIVATVLAVRRRRGLPLFRRASGLRDPITFRRPDSKMPADNQEGYLYPTSLNQTAPEEVLNMTPRPPPRTAINPEYEFQPQSGTLQRFEV
ncbi:uncharacterized protein [Littorina saxatilis]|uniref:uncharacterized protein n=1 Tax=Littorina saxatilis TaxID=31220 RepID=UPI0038B5B863